jgi:hypothetical protein
VSIKENGLENWDSIYDFDLQTSNRNFAYEPEYKIDNGTAVTAV